MKKTNLFIVFIAILTLFSCETDVDINAPYKDITVIYGIIDPAIDTQYVRITKAFTGNGNVYDLAQDPTNTNYPEDELVVIVQEISENGNVIKTHTLERTVNEVIKDEGVFDSSENVLFRFVEPDINQTSTYKIIVTNVVLNKVITSETLIVKNSVVSKPAEREKISFWSGTPNNGNYLTQLFNVTTGENVGRVDALLIFNYKEVYTTGDSIRKSVRMNLGELIAPSSLGNESLQWELNGEIFFNNIINAVPAIVPNLKYREVDYIDLEFNVAGSELSTYMTVAEPSTSINENTTTYTNITNGLGIFSSRSIIPWTPSEPGGSYLLNISSQTMLKLNRIGRDFCFGPDTPTSEFGCNY